MSLRFILGTFSLSPRDRRPKAQVSILHRQTRSCNISNTVSGLHSSCRFLDCGAIEVVLQIGKREGHREDGFRHPVLEEVGDT